MFAPAHGGEEIAGGRREKGGPFLQLVVRKRLEKLSMAERELEKAWCLLFF